VTWLAWGLSLLALAAWLVPLVDVLRSRWRPLKLTEVEPDGPEPLPRFSVIVPALNEETTVEQAMRSLLAVDYPDLEIIAVNDRSTDRTGEILQRLAREDARLRVTHVRDLPAGWLGKNHALHVGAAAATGRYILFTDADVHFEASALRRAVRHAESEAVDHLVVFPEVVLRGFWETVSVSFFGVIFALHVRPWRVPDPRSRAFVGVGAFNLVRAAHYRRAGGHAALPMDVADDVKLGKVMKRSGGRATVLLSGGLVRVRWVEGGWGIVTGLTKNMYGGLDYSPLKAMAAIAGLFVLAVWPVMGLLMGPWGSRAVCAVLLAMMVAAFHRGEPAPGASPLYGLTFPLGALVMMLVILRSMWYTHRQGGIFWRGTLYPLEELRRNLV
jgi:hypothetical protein